MTTQHTPGNWELGHQLSNGFSVVHEISPGNGNLLLVATCETQGKYLGHEITEENARSNAKLIAAAPELVNQLGQIADMCMGDGLDYCRGLTEEKPQTQAGLEMAARGLRGLFMTIADKANAAINKAIK